MFPISVWFSIHKHTCIFIDKKGATLRDQLLLAVKWDRPDVAKKLFPDCGSWPLDIIEEAMTSALITNKPAFVKLLLKRGIVMRDYLTVGLLRMLYNECVRMFWNCKPIFFCVNVLI